MLDPTAIPYERLSGLDITAVAPAGEVRRFCSLAPNRRTELLDLQRGDWVVRNDSPFVLRLEACSKRRLSPIRTLSPSESWNFKWNHDCCKLTATPLVSAQIFRLPPMATGTDMQRADALKFKTWEKLFCRYMVAARTGCKRLSEGNRRTPDFTIALGGRLVPVELKQFSRNDQEQHEAELLASQGYSEGATIEIGLRLAKATNSARSQLRSFLKQHGEGPAILAIIDPCRLHHAEPHHVAATLDGHETMRIASDDGSHIGTFRKENRRRAPHDRNAILSAIAVLCLSRKEDSSSISETDPDSHETVANLVVYHNPHAKHRISPGAFAAFGFPQFSLESTAPPPVRAFASTLNDSPSLDPTP